MRLKLPLLAVALLVASAPARADEQSTVRVNFAAGTSDATIDAAITGYASVDYLVGARAGQVLTVELDTDNAANNFNVIPPDEDDVAVFVGSSGGQTYSGTLDLDGDWKIRVYLVRAAARRNETANYSLSIAVAGQPDPAVAREANDFGPREWDARGQLGCAAGGQPMQTAACPFKVVRYKYEPGATIFVEAPGSSRLRILYFLDGEWSTDSAAEIDVRKRHDLWSLVVEDEAYEIPDAVLFGG